MTKEKLIKLINKRKKAFRAFYSGDGSWGKLARLDIELDLATKGQWKGLWSTRARLLQSLGLTEKDTM